MGDGEYHATRDDLRASGFDHESTTPDRSHHLAPHLGTVR